MREVSSTENFAEQDISPFMLLSELLNPFVELPKKMDREVLGITTDSRDVEPGYVFIAQVGYGHHDGRDFIQEALHSGAVAVLSELTVNQDTKTSLLMPAHTSHVVVPHIQIYNLTELVGHVADKFYNQPSMQMQMIGVTGTNGKTTITTLLSKAMKQLDILAGLIGTHGQGLDIDKLNYTGLTTPGPVALQTTLASMRDLGCEAVSMEVSSHGIAQSRVRGVYFDTLVLSNVTRDHLDFHGDISAYHAVKKKFLCDYAARYLVLNLDDEVGKQVAKDYQGSASLIGYTLRNDPNLGLDNVLRGYQVYADLNGLQMLVSYKSTTVKIATKLIGSFNAYNLLAVVASLLTMDFKLSEIAEALQGITPVEGRMESYGGGDKPTVIVDYAHTPAALEEVLVSLQRYCERRLVCVFGCGGDRDSGKRKLMGQIAERYADHVIITDDNPRHESSKRIVEQVLRGFLCPWAVDVIHDRTKAIVHAIDEAMPGDVILIAGKGHESYQIIGDEKIAFSDKEQVKFLLNLRADA